MRKARAGGAKFQAKNALAQVIATARDIEIAVARHAEDLILGCRHARRAPYTAAIGGRRRAEHAWRILRMLYVKCCDPAAPRRVIAAPAKRHKEPIIDNSQRAALHPFARNE